MAKYPYELEVCGVKVPMIPNSKPEEWKTSLEEGIQFWVIRTFIPDVSDTFYARALFWGPDGRKFFAEVSEEKKPEKAAASLTKEVQRCRDLLNNIWK